MLQNMYKTSSYTLKKPSTVFLGFRVFVELFQNQRSGHPRNTYDQIYHNYDPTNESSASRPSIWRISQFSDNIYIL